MADNPIFDVAGDYDLSVVLGLVFAGAHALGYCRDYRIADAQSTPRLTLFKYDCDDMTRFPAPLLPGACETIVRAWLDVAVATGHGRDAIGIDLDERNAWLARARVGMLLDVEHAGPATV